MKNMTLMTLRIGRSNTMMYKYFDDTDIFFFKILTGISVVTFSGIGALLLSGS